VDHVEPDLKIAPVLVTGASGYLGSRIVARLRAQSSAVIGTSRHGSPPCELTDFRSVERLVIDTGVTTVIHCAAQVPRSDPDYHDDEAAGTSLKMVANLITAAPRHIVFTSTMTVYGDVKKLPVLESDSSRTLSGYSSAKKAAEELLLGASHLRATILRLPGLFGPPRRGGLLYNAALAFANGKAPRTPGKPPLWAAMHVDDAADLCIRATRRDGSNSVVMNAGYPDRVSIPSVLAQLAAEFRVPPPDCAAGPEFEMDLELLQQEIGLPDGDLRTRLAQLAQWVRNEQILPRDLQ